MAGRPIEAPKRDSAGTRDRILQAALAEFAEHGYSGGRIDRISQAAGVNVRMIYHYFGKKDDLYLAALEETYRRIRERELTLDLDKADPIAAIRQLTELTFDFLSQDPHFVRLIMSENLINGSIISRSESIPSMTQPLLDSLESIIKRGQEAGVFHQYLDPAGVYVTILGLCFIHVSNRHTLGSMFQRDFGDPEWLRERKAAVTDVVVGYLAAR